MPQFTLRSLDLTVTPMTATDVVDVLDRPAPDGPVVIANLNLHGLYLALTEPGFAAFCRGADYVVVDGWPIWLWARLRLGSRVNRRHRVGSSDWVGKIIEADRAMRVVAVAGRPESARLATRAVRGRCHALDWVGFDGYDNRPQTDDAAAVELPEAIERGCLVLVGMGMPVQEAWIEQNRSLLAGCYVANVGGCIDYLSGAQRLAPRWLGPLGLEWLFRLCCDPRRLWHRYLIEPFHLAYLLGKARFRHQLTVLKSGRRAPRAGSRAPARFRVAGLTQADRSLTRESVNG